MLHKRFQQHCLNSIEKVKEFFPDINVNDFDFAIVTMENVKKEILNLKNFKSEL